MAVAAAMSTALAGTVNYTRAGQVMQVQLGHFHEVFTEQQQLGEPASTFVGRWYDRCRNTRDVDIYHELPQCSVKADTRGLPLLWRVLSTPEGVVFEDPPAHRHVRTGGGYLPARCT